MCYLAMFDKGLAKVLVTREKTLKSGITIIKINNHKLAIILYKVSIIS